MIHTQHRLSAAGPPQGAKALMGGNAAHEVASVGARRTRIKICGLTREHDVDAAVQAGADAVGFVLYPASPRYVTPQRAAELSRRLPVFVTPVLLFVNETTLNIVAARAINQRAICQFHGDETPQDCQETGLPYLRAARIPLSGAEAFDLVKFSQDYADAQAILVDAHVDGYGGGGKTFNWKAINWSHPQLNASDRLVLSGGLTPANVTDGIVQVRPWAVDVSSGVESDAPGLSGQTVKGIKDPEKIFQFVAAVRRADKHLANL
jgi:phosphoribosylanthranilate isomerase